MSEVNSLSLFVGTGQCNANCKHCAGRPLRVYAPKKDGEDNEARISKAIESCYMKGAMRLSLSSSGEPTLSPTSVTKALLLTYAHKDFHFDPINLYSNGIRIGEDKAFADKYLRLWKGLGLTTVYITVHSIDLAENARHYGVRSYPPLETIVYRLRQHGLSIRANIILSKEMISDLRTFSEAATFLKEIGFNHIAAWPIRNDDDVVDANLAPDQKVLDEIEEKWRGVPWVRVHGEKTRTEYSSGKKLTLFQNGALSSSWCSSR